MSVEQIKASAFGGSAIGLFTYTPTQIETAVNAVVDGPDLTAGGTIDVPGERSLDELVASDGQAILATPPGERTPDEVRRLNRLMVEKVVPGGFVQLHAAGWRPTLMLYGVLGVFVGGLFWFFTRSWPWQHPWANKAEVDLIETGQSKVGEAEAPNAIPVGPLVRSRNQWLFSAANFFSNFGWVFLITLMPRFLEEQYRVPVDERGLMTSVPLYAAMFAMPIGGWFTDRLTVGFGRRVGRAVPMGVFKIPCFIALLLVPYMPSAWFAVACFTVMSFCQDFGNPAVWAFAQDTAGKQVGAVLGWGNMWGNFGAGIAVYSVGGLAAAYGWDTALTLAAVSYMLCAIAGSTANAADPLFKATATTPEGAPS